MSLSAIEFEVLRRTIATRGTARMVLFAVTMVAWASLATVVAAGTAPPIATLFSLLILIAGFESVQQQRIATVLKYADADEACDAAFVGGPVALAWSRFDAQTRARARARYRHAIEPWRRSEGYRIPGEFVIVAGRRPR